MRVKRTGVWLDADSDSLRIVIWGNGTVAFSVAGEWVELSPQQGRDVVRLILSSARESCSMKPTEDELLAKIDELAARAARAECENKAVRQQLEDVRARNDALKHQLDDVQEKSSPPSDGCPACACHIHYSGAYCHHCHGGVVPCDQCVVAKGGLDDVTVLTTNNDKLSTALGCDSSLTLDAMARELEVAAGRIRGVMKLAARGRYTEARDGLLDCVSLCPARQYLLGLSDGAWQAGARR